MLQELRSLGGNLVVAVEHDAHGVADGGGHMVLEQHAARRPHADVAVFVGEARDGAQTVIGSGDEVLHDELLVIGARLQVAEELRKLLGALDGVDLLLVGDVGVVVTRRVRGLGDERVTELLHRDLRLGVGAVVHPRLGVRHADLLADSVEALLLRNLVEQGEIDVGHHIPLLEFGLVLREGAHIPVGRTGEHKAHLALGGNLGALLAQSLHEVVALVDVGHNHIGAQAARRDLLDLEAREHDGLDAVGLMEAAHPSVGEQVTADDDGLQVGLEVGFAFDGIEVLGHGCGLSVSLHNLR